MAAGANRHGNAARASDTTGVSAVFSMSVITWRPLISVAETAWRVRRRGEGAFVGNGSAARHFDWTIVAGDSVHRHQSGVVLRTFVIR